MKASKLIRYRLCVSRYFPKGHKKEGLETNFINSINSLSKIHTIRANYSLWEERMKKVQEGKAVIELYYWIGKPYRSTQETFKILDKDSGCGVQKLEFQEMIMTTSPVIITRKKGVLRIFKTKEQIELSSLASNDGLSYDDFQSWFDKYDLSEPMAIIHFTKFRY